MISAFGQEFVKTGALSAGHHAALRTAFDERNVGDYDYAEPFAPERARDLLDRAEAFIAEAERYLREGD